MEYIPAAMLSVLTAVRIPTARDKERASVLRATFYAAIACTLFIPLVYMTADPLIGGRNHIGLVLILAILAGFWQFHTAIVLATFPEEARRRRHLVRGRLTAAVAGTCVVLGFSLSHVDVTNQNLPLAYGDQPGMQLFLWTGSAFIIWVCMDVSWNCFRSFRGFHGRSFKSGVICFAAGCLFMAMALGNRLTLGVVAESTPPTADLAGSLNWWFPAYESIAVILVSIGLMIPRLPELSRKLRHSIRSRWLMVLLTPVWRRSSAERKYLLRNRWSPLLDPFTANCDSHSHRRVVEIRDCQLRGMALLPRDRALVSQAEQLLQGH